ncbi:MAG: DUF456 family protein [Phycisphaerales bacterium]|nr:DUF456 family protein [Phycisphaerales bacterium]
MTELIHWLMVGGFAVAGAGCILLVIMQLPGTWLMLVLAGGCQMADAWWLREDAQAGWWALGAGLVLALCGEVAETMAGAAGAKAGGAGKRGMWGALLGGIAGGLLGTFLIPIPVIGSLLGAVGGAFAGACVGELTGRSPRTLQSTLKPAAGAAAGRAAGTLIKAVLAGLIWLVLLVGLALN